MANLFIGFHWWWLLASVVIVQIVGAIWYGPLFSKVYGKELKLTKADMDAGQKGMAKLMVWEIASRLVFFLGLGLLLQFVGIDHKRTVGILYFAAVLSTEWSAVIWSNGNTWRLWSMRAGKVLIDLLIALLLYGLL
ncbi:MAG: DUF1761 family protein [Candidatus Absconditabacterales bacterium]